MRAGAIVHALFLFSLIDEEVSVQLTYRLLMTSYIHLTYLAVTLFATYLAVTLLLVFGCNFHFHLPILGLFLVSLDIIPRTSIIFARWMEPRTTTTITVPLNPYSVLVLVAMALFSS